MVVVVSTAVRMVINRLNAPSQERAVPFRTPVDVEVSNVVSVEIETIATVPVNPTTKRSNSVMMMISEKVKRVKTRNFDVFLPLTFFDFRCFDCYCFFLLLKNIMVL